MHTIKMIACLDGGGVAVRKIDIENNLTILSQERGEFSYLLIIEFKQKKYLINIEKLL